MPGICRNGYLLYSSLKSAGFFANSALQSGLQKPSTCCSYISVSDTPAFTGIPQTGSNLFSEIFTRLSCDSPEDIDEAPGKLSFTAFSWAGCSCSADFSPEELHETPTRVNDASKKIDFIMVVILCCKDHKPRPALNSSGTDLRQFLT